MFSSLCFTFLSLSRTIYQLNAGLHIAIGSINEKSSSSIDHPLVQIYVEVQEITIRYEGVSRR